MSGKHKWEKQYQFYHNLFKDIPTLSSSELISKYDIGLEPENRSQTEKSLIPVVLIDVRSKPEREVSMIPSAISLKEYEKSVANGSISNAQIAVVTYCTVGYRSGIEARRIRDKYGIQDIYSLDGIVAYTHSQNSKLVQMVDSREEETENVHTFARFWNDVADSYKAKAFSPFGYIHQSAKVFARVCLRTSQRFGTKIRMCCKRK